MDIDTYPPILAYRLLRLAVAMNSRGIKIWPKDKGDLLAVIINSDIPEKHEIINSARDI